MDDPLASLSADLSNAPEVLGQLDLDALTRLFCLDARQYGLPAWPGEETQSLYTSECGLTLMQRTAAFAALLEADGAFRDAWRALDFGCGFGRIATYLLRFGGPSQLDLCDPWKHSVEIIRANGFLNRLLPVSEIVAAGELPQSTYDFVYAFSVFTHLDRTAFESNLAALLGTLKPGGKLYFTVRHSEYFRSLKVHAPPTEEELERDGMWMVRFPMASLAHFGNTIVARTYIERLCGPSLRYLGQPHQTQHLYAVTAG